MSIESREVLEVAYMLARARGTMLRHGVIVNRDRQAVEVLCRRVKLDSLADRNAGNPSDSVTCKYCLRKISKLAAPASGAPQEESEE